MEIDPNNPPPSPSPKYPEGFENWSMEDKENFRKEKESWQVPVRNNPKKETIVQKESKADLPEGLIAKLQELADRSERPAPIKALVYSLEQPDITREKAQKLIETAIVFTDQTKSDLISFFAPETAPVVIPESTPIVTPEPPLVVEKEKTIEEEWAEFEKLRNELAKTEVLKLDYSSETGTDVENLRAKYAGEKDRMAGLIRKREYAKQQTEGPLIQEDEKNFNDLLFDELVKKENDAYLNALREVRESGFAGKVSETTKRILGTKTMKWYLGLSKGQRMALSFGVGGVVGLVAGGAATMGVASYLGLRAARTGLSAFAAAGAGEWANKRWSMEDLKIAEEKEIEELKKNPLSLEEKSKGLFNIEKRYKKERIKISLKKMGTTVLAGAGTGLLTGLAEGAFLNQGVGGNIRSTIENKLPPRQGFGHTDLKPTNSITKSVVVDRPVAPKVEPAMPVPVAPKPEVSAPVVVEKPFLSQEVLLQEVKAGDSVWKLLEKTLENNKEFKVMTEAQKTYVLSNLTNKMLGSPATYGFRPGGAVEIGYKLDFGEVFKNNKEIETLLSKAKETITENGVQEKLILKNNEAIATWLENNPGKPLNEETVSEILSAKPKVELKTEITKIELSEPPDLLPTEPLEVVKIPPLMADLPQFRSMAGDVATFDYNIENAFKEEIDKIYGGHGGIFGLSKVSGINTKEWGEMARLPAKKVLEYFRNPDVTNDLPNDVLKNLQTSDKHRGLVEQVSGLIGEAHQKSGVEFEPHQNENMEVFIKRLGAFLMKNTKKQ